MSNAPEAIPFPSADYPSDPRIAHLMGIYEQRQEGLRMQRIQVPAGQIDAHQLRRLAELARDHTPDYPLHLTTRQDVEMHGVKPATVPAIHQGLADVGLSTVGTCGDTLRNICCSPESGLFTDAVDVLPLIKSIKAAAEAQPFIRTMPRKFKISVSASPRATGRPYVQDLGLVAQEDGTFHVVIAGSLGARPNTGIPLMEGLKVDEVVPLVLACLRIHNDESDRENRRRARLRHVRERLGEDDFKQRVLGAFRKEVAAWEGPRLTLETPDEDTPLQARLQPPRGDLWPDEAETIAEIAERTNATLRIGFEQNLLLYSTIRAELPEPVAQWAGRARIVACPGNTWCRRGIVNSREAAARLRDSLPPDVDVNIGISGCPNNCPHAAVADIGLVGRVKTIDGVRTECFRLQLGGGKGMTPELAEEVHPAVPADALPTVIGRVIDAYGRPTPPAPDSFRNFIAESRASLVGDIAGQIAGDRGECADKP